METLVKMPEPPSVEQRLNQDLKAVYIHPKEGSMVSSHEERHVGKYYQISKEMLEKLPITYMQSRTKERQSLVDELERTLNYVMVRQVPWDLVQSMKQGTGKLTALVGRKKCGKTTCMNYLAQYGTEQGHIVIATQGLEFSKETLGMLRSNDTRKSGVEIFDQPRFTMDWFARLNALNRNSFEKVVLKGDYSMFDFDWSADQVYDERHVKGADTKTRTVADLVDLAIRNPADAPSLLYRFVEEMYSLTPNEPQVLVLIDDMNFWEHPSEFVHPRTVKPIPSRQLALVDALSKFALKAPSNGHVVFSLSSEGFLRNGPTLLAPAQQIVEMTKYSDEELLTALRHYKTSNILEFPSNKMNMRWVAWMKVSTCSLGCTYQNPFIISVTVFRVSAVVFLESSFS